MQNTKRTFSVWYFILALFALMWLQSALFSRHRETVSYSEFKQLLAAGSIETVTIADQSITGTVAVDSLDGILPAERVEALRRDTTGTAHAFVTIPVDDPGLVEALENAGVMFAGRPGNPWFAVLAGWMLPVLLFAGVWLLIMRRMSPHAGAMSVGKSRAKVYVEKATGVTFADVAGIDEARAELQEIVDFLKNPGTYRRLGGKIPKGALLVGPPGAGKTLLARAVAGEAGVPFFSLTGADFVEMFVGVGAARVRDLFSQAQALAPSIVFIDEIDALGRARSAGIVPGGHDEREQTLNQLLAEMDGFDTGKGLIVMAATNRPEILDPALLRPGRFDRKVLVDRPDLHGRERILEVHTRDVTLAPDVDLGQIAARTPGFVGADLANMVNEAALRAARDGKDAVGMADLDEAIDRVVAGTERRSRIMSAREKGIVAYHEAGHALVAEDRPRADRVAKISIIPRGVAALGYTQQQPTEDRFLMTRSELLDRLDVLLGGRVAEDIVFGDVSTGAHDDLQRATDLARHMVVAYGMTDVLGPVAFQPRRQALFLDAVSEPPREYSEETARVVDAEIRRLLEESAARVRATLEARRSQLETLARTLMQQEVVDRKTLLSLLSTEEQAGVAAWEAGAFDAERDPVCGMPMSPQIAAASTRHGGERYLFCSQECRTEFESAPHRYAREGAGDRPVQHPDGTVHLQK